MRSLHSSTRDMFRTPLGLLSGGQKRDLTGPPQHPQMSPSLPRTTNPPFYSTHRWRRDLASKWRCKRELDCGRNRIGLNGWLSWWKLLCLLLLFVCFFAEDRLLSNERGYFLGVNVLMVIFCLWLDRSYFFSSCGVSEINKFWDLLHRGYCEC